MIEMEFDQQEQQLLLEINPTDWYGEKYHNKMKRIILNELGGFDCLFDNDVMDNNITIPIPPHWNLT